MIWIYEKEWIKYEVGLCVQSHKRIRRLHIELYITPSPPFSLATSVRFEAILQNCIVQVYITSDTHQVFRSRR